LIPFIYGVLDLVKPGEATASKMKKLIELHLKQTLDENEKDVDLLLDFAGALEYLVISWDDSQLHFKNLIGKKYDSIEEVPEQIQRCFFLALRHDTSLFIFFDLWRELGQAVRELICSDYDSVPRSLRWMIEACIFWADMQLDHYNAQEYFEYYCSQKDKVTEDEFLRVSNTIYSVNEARLAERLTFKEKYRRLAVKEIIQNLSILKNHSKGYDKGPRIGRELNKCYSRFSEYSHITLSTLKEIHKEPGELHFDFAFFQDFRYDKRRFEIELSNIYTALDLILAVILLVETQFFSYETPNLFFECLGDVKEGVANKIKQLSHRLPFLSDMFSGK